MLVVCKKAFDAKRRTRCVQIEFLRKVLKKDEDAKKTKIKLRPWGYTGRKNLVL